MSERTVIRLADLRETMGEVELPNGRVVAVRAIDGIAMQQRQQLMEHSDPMLVWDIVGRCLPEATREEVLALSHVQARAVIEVASGVADAVLDELVKGSGAAEPNPAAGAPPTS